VKTKPNGDWEIDLSQNGTCLYAPQQLLPKQFPLSKKSGLVEVGELPIYFTSPAVSALKKARPR
jgi:hypothetical protein